MQTSENVQKRKFYFGEPLKAKFGELPLPRTLVYRGKKKGLSYQPRPLTAVPEAPPSLLARPGLP
jgi:hypothetical protein